jgi:Flp pilus assembly protein TadD
MAAALARAQAAERKSRWFLVALAAAVLGVLFLCSTALLKAQRQAEELHRAVDAALEQANELMRQKRWPEAHAVLEQASNRLGEGGPESLRRGLEEARRDLELVARLEAIRLKGARTVEGRFDTAGVDREYAEAFQEAGLGAVGKDPREVATRIRASAVRAEVLAALDNWATILWHPGPRLTWVLAVARKSDPDPWRDRVREPRTWNSRRRLERLAKRVPARAESPRFLGVLGIRLQALGGEGEAILRAAQGRQPGDFWINFTLGNTLLGKKKAGEAVGYYRAALASRPGTTAVHNNLGIALANQGNVAEAVREYRRAIALDPNFPPAHNGLGIALYHQGKQAEAVREFRRAIALDPKYAPAHTNLGKALYVQGKVAEAVKEFRRAIALDPRLAKAHYNLAIALEKLGRMDKAINEYGKAVALDPMYAQEFFKRFTDINELLKGDNPRKE